MAEHFREDSLNAVAVRLDAEHPQGFLFDPHQPQLRITDLSAVRGDGVFETILVKAGKPRKFSAHLDRLRRSANILGIGLPPKSSWTAAADLGLNEYKTRGGLPEELALRLTASRGVDGEPASEDPSFAGSYWALLTPVSDSLKNARAKPIAVTVLDRGYESTLAERAPWLLLGAKTLSYAVNMAALRWAEQHGFDDVIFSSTDGKALEGPISSIIVAERTEEGQLWLKTPHPGEGILAGTSQDAIFRAAKQHGWKTSYASITVEELRRAEHIWLVSSIKLVSPVHRLDDQDISVDPQLTRTLLDFLEEASG